MIRILMLVGLGAALVLPAPARADLPRPEDPSGVTVDLLTMGPGDRLFEVFGHAALCVGKGLTGDCFNYGVTDFQQSGMVLGFLRGRTPFWVEAIPYRRLLYYYQSRDRDVFRQKLVLGEAQLDRILGRLRHDVAIENRNYPYDHFRSNCTTKVRDVIDEALGGALRRATDTPVPPTLRELVRRGFAGRPVLEWLGDALMGRTLDRLPTRWENMFLPDVLRAEVAALRVNGASIAPLPADKLNQRRAPDPIAGSPHSGLWFGGAVALGVLLAALLFGRRRGGARAVLGVVAGLLGVFGGIAWFIAIVSTSPDLRHNEALSVLWPTDLWLVGAAVLASAKRPRLSRAVRGYLMARGAVAGLAIVLYTVGLLRQPFEFHAATVLAFSAGLLWAGGLSRRS